MWQEKQHDFGLVKGGSIIEHHFTHDKSKIIRHYEPSCPCMTAVPKDNGVKVIWRTKKVDEEFTSTKFVSVIYADNELELLELKAHLV